MTQWFMQSAAAELGPFAPSQVLEMVRRGEITRETKLKKDDSAWFPAGEIGGLFEAAVRPTVKYLCPICRGEVKIPPCECPHCGRQIDVAHRKVVEHTIETAGRNGQAPSGPGASMQSWLDKIRRRGNS
jgi:hypothetical protein